MASTRAKVVTVAFDCTADAYGQLIRCCAGSETHNSSDMCERGAVRWIDVHLHDCVYGTRDIIGFTFGVVSIGCWVVAQVSSCLIHCHRAQTLHSTLQLGPSSLQGWIASALSSSDL